MLTCGWSYAKRYSQVIIFNLFCVFFYVTVSILCTVLLIRDRDVLTRKREREREMRTMFILIVNEHVRACDPLVEICFFSLGERRR